MQKCSNFSSQKVLLIGRKTVKKCRYCSYQQYLPLGGLLLSNFLRFFPNKLTLKAPTPQNGQTHSNNSSAVADELSECV